VRIAFKSFRNFGLAAQAHQSALEIVTAAPDPTDDWHMTPQEIEEEKQTALRTYNSFPFVRASGGAPRSPYDHFRATPNLAGWTERLYDQSRAGATVPRGRTCTASQPRPWH